MRLKGSPRRGLFGATLGFFVGFAAVALFGPTADRFKEVMDLNPTLVGFLVATPALSGSLLRIPFAAWVDRDGGRTPFLVLFGLAILGMTGLTIIVFGFYPDGLTIELYPVLLFLGLLCGSGIAIFSVGIGQVSYWFPQDEQGWALGTYAGLGNLGPGIFSALIPVALSSIGLAASYLAWLLFLVLGAIAYYFTGFDAPYFQLRERGMSEEEAKEQARKHGQELFPAASPFESIREAAKNWRIWPLVMLYFSTFGGFLALTSWLPTYCKTYLALSGVLAGGVTALYSVFSSLIRVPGGFLADRVGGERTALVSLGVLFVGALVVSLASTTTVAVVGLLLMAAAMGVNNAAVFKLVPEYCPDAVGGASGWVGGLGAFGGFALPPVMGAFVNWQGEAGYATGFLTFAGLAVVGLALVLLLSSTRGSVADG